MRDLARIVRRQRVVGQTDEREDLVGTRDFDSFTVRPLDDDVVDTVDDIERDRTRAANFPFSGLESGTDRVGHIWQSYTRRRGDAARARRHHRVVRVSNLRVNRAKCCKQIIGNQLFLACIQFILNVQITPRMTDPRAFIERMGLAAENDGLSRIAGRLFGALILHSEPCSLDDLAEQLAVSKASVSTEARRLVERGIAERIGKPGDRRDYYCLTSDFFAQIIRFRLSRWATLHRLAREMQAANADTEPRLVRDRFAYIDEFNAFVLARV